MIGALYIPFPVALFVLCGFLFAGGGCVGWGLRCAWEASR